MSEKPQYPPLRSPMVVDGQLTDLWARYFQHVVTPYFERLLNLEDMEILDWSNNRQKDHERRIAEMEKLLQELWQTNDKGFTKRFEDIENILQFVDGPKDATLLRKLDDLEALIFSVLIPHPQNTDTALGAVGAKNPPIDADKTIYRDSTAADVLVTSTWTQIKAFLGLAITAGKTITATQNTSLDEAVAMSSKAPKAQEAWHEIGAGGEPGFENSWVNVDPANTATAAFFKDSFGIVHIKGFIKSGKVNSAIFTLPGGYRPPRYEHFPCASNGAFGQAYVLPDGRVWMEVGSNVLFSIAGITFRAV